MHQCTTKYGFVLDWLGLATKIQSIKNAWPCHFSISPADMFNGSLQSSIFTDDLKIAGMAPIFKGDRNDMYNYRLISILCTVTRVFGRLLYNQLYDHLIDNKILYVSVEVQITSFYISCTD